MRVNLIDPIDANTPGHKPQYGGLRLGVAWQGQVIAYPEVKQALSLKACFQGKRLGLIRPTSPSPAGIDAGRQPL